MVRRYVRAAAAVGALGLGLLGMSPAAAATGHQASANAVTLSIAGNANGSGLATATYENGKETKTGETQPAFPNPGGQQNFRGGVLAQEATAKPGFSAACAGLAGDGGSVVNIGDSSCLEPGDLLSGSLGSLDLSSLIDASAGTAIGQLPQQLQDALSTVPGGADAVTGAIDDALAQARQQFGDGGLVADLDLIEGRCTAGSDGPSGSATLTNARIAVNIPGRDPLVLVDLPTNPPPNTHVFTSLSKVLTLVLEGVRSDLVNSLDGQAAPLQQVIDQVEDNVVTNIHDQVEANLKPLEDNLLDITLNQQSHPTPRSIDVRALNVDLLPAAKAQLDGNPLANLQIGNASCAPVDTAQVLGEEASRPAQRTSPKLGTPTGVSAGLASVPASQQHHGLARSTWALLALAGLGLVGAGAAAARRLLG